MTDRSEQIQAMPSEQARTQWRALLDAAAGEEREIIIERHGKPTVVVIGYELYRKLLPTLNRIRGREIDLSDQGRQMASVLEALAAGSTETEGDDIQDWQRAIRRDRPLPGRES